MTAAYWVSPLGAPLLRRGVCAITALNCKALPVHDMLVQGVDKCIAGSRVLSIFMSCSECVPVGRYAREVSAC